MAKNILLVDGSSFIPKVIRRTLEQIDYHVIAEARDEKDGIIKFDANESDLDLVIVNMDSTDGMQVIKAIRETNLEIPIIIIVRVDDMSAVDDVTGTVDWNNASKSELQIKEAIETGVQDVIVLPFKLDTLLSKVQKAVGDALRQRLL